MKTRVGARVLCSSCHLPTNRPTNQPASKPASKRYKTATSTTTLTCRHHRRRHRRPRSPPPYPHSQGSPRPPCRRRGGPHNPHHPRLRLRVVCDLLRGCVYGGAHARSVSTNLGSAATTWLCYVLVLCAVLSKTASVCSGCLSCPAVPEHSTNPNPSPVSAAIADQNCAHQAPSHSPL